MTALGFLFDRFSQFGDDDAIIWRDSPYSYSWLASEVKTCIDFLDTKSIRHGAVVGIQGDFSPRGVALLLALIEREAIVVPLTTSVEAKKQEFLDVAQVEKLFVIDESDSILEVPTDKQAVHDHYETLRSNRAPGLVLFSSGSTGKSKAAVHNLIHVLEKFHVTKRKLRAISFLLYDHIGGFNTLLYALSNGGCIVTVPNRDPDVVLRAIERHQVELLPTSPTFLNLLLLSEAYTRFDLTSLKVITYGTEPMPESTLLRFHQLFPDVNLQQTYGLSEIGIMRSKSKSSDSLWVQLGGEGFETRVIDNMLQVKAKSAMLGYLNADSPFTEDGWFKTGDEVEVDGDYFRILGRKSELINVGGEKVYPAEVESVIQSFDNVAEVVVFGTPHPILGNIVCARIRLGSPTSEKEFTSELKKYCGQKLEKFKVPVRIQFTEESMCGTRFKKQRNLAEAV